jgi:hypothetical protein
MGAGPAFHNAGECAGVRNLMHRALEYPGAAKERLDAVPGKWNEYSAEQILRFVCSVFGTPRERRRSKMRLQRRCLGLRREEGAAGHRFVEEIK